MLQNYENPKNDNVGSIDSDRQTARETDWKMDGQMDRQGPRWSFSATEGI